jgi:hypothetical protein
MALSNHDLPPGRLKNDFVEVFEAMFQYVKEHANSLLESWAFKKAN